MYSDKRAREGKKAEKKREKARKRQERRERGPQEIAIVSAEEAAGTMRSIEQTMKSLQAGGTSGGGERATIPAKLFVGSLSRDTNDQSLREAFEEFGEVLEAVVVMDRDTGSSRGFGFVTLADRKDAPQAIEGLDRTELDGRTIAVRVATERR